MEKIKQLDFKKIQVKQMENTQMENTQRENTQRENTQRENTQRENTQMETKNTEINRMKNPELHQNLKSLAAEERRMTHEAVLHIMEVGRRKLYLDMKFESLFSYLTEEIGYCNASAQLRIDAARLMMEVPTLGEKIEEGTMSLSQVNQMQKVFREVAKTRAVKITREEKQSLVEQVENKSARETQVFLAQNFDLPIIEKETTKVQRDESVRYELTLTKDEVKLLEEARSLMGHTLEKASKNVPEKFSTNSSGNSSIGIKALLLHWAQKEVRSRTSVRKTKATSPSEVQQARSTKVLTPSIKKQILNRDKCCQFRYSPNENICGSKYLLEVDHVRPRWDGGSNEFENLRVLCRTHNQWRYQVGR